MKTHLFHSSGLLNSFLSWFCLLTFWAVFQVQYVSAQGNEPDWKRQNPYPTGNDLMGIHFVNEQTGWIIGDDGTILKTSNWGNSWTTQFSGTSRRLTSISFSDIQNGWAVGEYGTILKTTNSGTNWIFQNSGTTVGLNSVKFIDAQTGWVVADDGSILKTTNGGNTWINQDSGFSNLLLSICFTNAQIGWAVGSGKILKTSNGGNTWQTQSSGNITEWLFSVHFIDSQTGWTVGDNGLILKTSNGGGTWTKQNSGTKRTLYSVHFVNLQTGWAVSYGDTILKTSNGGTSWQVQSGKPSQSLTGVHFTSSQNGWAVGYFGTILHTSNGGTSWHAQSRGTIENLNSIHFTDNQTGWAVGDKGLYKTINSGGTWEKQNIGRTTILQSIFFVNAQFGWMVGYSGSIWKTTNGGSTWTRQISGTTKPLKSVYFIDMQTGWATGEDGCILKSSNGGTSWITQNSETTNDLWAIQFTNTQTGCAVGTEGTILKTTDGGDSWTLQNSGLTVSLLSVKFIDTLNCYATGSYGVILKTSNGGTSWNQQTSGTSNTLYSICFINPQNGWAVGQNGTTLKTTNSGNNWTRLISNTTNDLFSVYFTDSIHGWASGERGTIITTKTNNYLELENSVSLLQGYLFEKTGSNCNSSNIPVSNKLLKATPGPYYSISQSDGNYSLRLPLSDSAQVFNIQPLNLNNPAFKFNTVCPPTGNILVTVDTIPDTLLGNNFGFEITPCHHLDVQLSSNRRRRCFVNTTSVSYVNQGSLAAPNAYLLVEFPHWVKPIQASSPYVAVNDSVWRFNLDTVSPGESGAFTITDSVLCDNLEILELSQCTKATIFPAPNCPNPAGWSGAEVSVSGTCENGIVNLGIYNKTTVNLPDSLEYTIFMDSNLVRKAKVKLAAKDSLKILVTSQGAGVYLSVNQVANHPQDLFVSASVDGCGNAQDTVTSVSTHFPITQRPNSKTQCLPIIGAYDPNDKQVFPIGFTKQNIIAPNTRLEYLVRFQNTGNDTAFTVFVIDTLDQNLNVESFEMGAASHPYQLSMQTSKSGKTFLRWQFNNILLPDSNTNEPASNGFIQFRISPKPGLALGSKVRNRAEIYFDFNPPIITNKTLTTYDVIVFRDSTLNANVQIITSTEKKLEQELGVKLYPNPVTQNQLTASFAETGSLTLFDARGSMVFLKENIQGIEALPVFLKAGFYFAMIETQKGRQHVKLVVE